MPIPVTGQVITLPFVARRIERENRVAEACLVGAAAAFRHLPDTETMLIGTIGAAVRIASATSQTHLRAAAVMALRDAADLLESLDR